MWEANKKVMNKGRRDSATTAARNVAKHAVAYDQEGKHELAIETYSQAAQYLLKAASLEPRKSEKGAYFAQATQYIQRAETLKRMRPAAPPESAASAPALPMPSGPATATAFTLPYTDSGVVASVTALPDDCVEVSPTGEHLYPDLDVPTVSAEMIESPAATAVEELPKLNGWVRQLTIKKPRMWKDRYVMLADGQLKYFKGEGGFPKGTVNLKGLRVVKLGASSNGKKISRAKSMMKIVMGLKSDLGFQILNATGLEILTLQTKYAEQYAAWTTALRDSIRILGE